MNFGFLYSAVRNLKSAMLVGALNALTHLRFDGFTSRRRQVVLEPTSPPVALDPNCESLWKKMIGKPYSGKLNVRFDEGELEIEP